MKRSSCVSASRSRSFVATLAVVAVAVAGCGGDDDAGGGDTEAFCAALAADAAGGQVDMDEDFEAGMAELERLRELAPGEIRDSLDTMMEVFTELENLDGDDEESFAAAMEVMFSPEVIAAGTRLEEFGSQECGIDPDDFEDSDAIDIDVSVGGDDEGDGSGGGDAGNGGIEDPLYDEFFDDPVDPSTVSLDGLKQYLDLNHTDAPWRTRLGAFSAGGPSPWSIGTSGEDLTDAEAVEVCTALVAYLAPYDAEGEVSISTYEANDGGGVGEETELISTTVGAGC